MDQVHLEGEIKVQRRYGPFDHQFSLLDKIYVERGTATDWNELKALHYKASETGVGPIFIRCVIEHSPGNVEVIGANVMTVPKILDAGRNQVFPHMKPNQKGVDSHLMQVMRTRWLNQNIRLNSRIVMDTMYRGAGIAYRFCNLAMRMSGYRFIEARSSMSKHNPFSFNAGMRAIAPNTASAQVQGLAMFAQNFQSPAYDLVAILGELQGMPKHLRERTLTNMRAFYYRHSSMEKSGDKRLSGHDRVNSLGNTPESTNYLIKQIMQLTFGATIYMVFQNPDHGIALPTRVPLSAFSNQSPTEPLRLDLL